jgi:hypothetical protein
VIGFALQKGMEKLGEWLLAQVAAGALSAAFGPIGWVFRIAAVAMNVEAMAVTTGEVLSSPACIRVTVNRALDVTMTLHPDPRHGEAGKPETAVWPSLAKTYQVTLQYKNGTSFELKGELPATTSNQPLKLKFSDVPAGGQFRIIAGVYSASGWLAGAWQSDWLVAKPTEGSTQKLPDASIKENLVPLAADAQYVFKERIVAQNGGFKWLAGGAPPSTTRASLACGAGATLCDLVGITINNSAFQVGYAWRASGQDLPPDSPTAPKSEDQLYALHNLSVLADPGSKLKASAIGLTDRPGIAYAPSTNGGDAVDQTNFVIDPRGGGMNLRQVTLGDGHGDFGLGNAGLQSWGSFPLENIDAVAVHPSNAVIACSWQDAKLMILNLPSTPAPDGKAPVALMVSGEGLRQGLMSGPKALAVAPDGRILVLESLNRRVQAFDTKGNPVPSFTPGPPLNFKLDTSQVAATLDGGKVPDAFQAGLEGIRFTRMFTLPASFVAQLDSARFAPEGDPLIKALSEKGVLLAYEPDAMTDPAQSAQIEVLQAGKSWIVTDPRNFAWHLLLEGGTIAVYRRVTQAEVRVEKPGQQWLLLDLAVGLAWRLAPSFGSPGKTEVRQCLSYFPLRPARVGAFTYLDMAVEALGYVYVLAYLNDGADPTDYVLDVYAPDGTFVLRTPDPSVTDDPQNVVAGRIAVDIWRNLYALTYEPLNAPGPQPGLAHWNPTPPLFTLPLSSQPDFNQSNIGAVKLAFSGHGIDLSSQAFITVVDPDGTWEVKDGETVYHIYRSGDGLQVYAVPA